MHFFIFCFLSCFEKEDNFYNLDIIDLVKKYPYLQKGIDDVLTVSKNINYPSHVKIQEDDYTYILTFYVYGPNYKFKAEDFLDDSYDWVIIRENNSNKSNSKELLNKLRDKKIIDMNSNINSYYGYYYQYIICKNNRNSHIGLTLRQPNEFFHKELSKNEETSRNNITTSYLKEKSLPYRLPFVMVTKILNGMNA